ncbi:phytanoyl-coa dioxygenase like protein [Plakobranchus ocellatus]|uniref:Phytanoyl-coa dioxygenase like protein n=1 Tax=Plakobranchus ocellatus TaxID=259542 RepID=A0AAV4D7J3_9GAST|nr:phytanoyl-coa dioxygenase like protein [Plakobranchus ocellatus]
MSIKDMQKLAEDFKRDGFVCPIDVLNAQETEELRRNFDQTQDLIGKEKATYSMHNLHVKDEWVLRIATHPRILEPLRVILGPNLILLDSRFICKYPTEGGDEKEAFVAWHQDARYWGLKGDVVSVWLAVDDADDENACMNVIPGTHTNGILEHITETKAGNLLSSNQAIVKDLYDPSKAVSCPVKAGQMSLHQGLLVHGSGTNRSPRRRCGYVIRYVATTARPIEDPDRPRSFPATVLVSGKSDNRDCFEDHAPDWFTWRE